MSENFKELLYHIVDWIFALIAIVISIKQDKVGCIFGILFIAFLLSVIIILNKKIRKYKLKIKTYENLLKSPYPLYGIVNYIAKDNENNYLNKDIKLECLSLDVKLVNEVMPNKHNDLQFFWVFDGINISEKTVDKLYLRIGGDSSSNYKDLGLKAMACIENSRECAKDCRDYIQEKCLKEYEMDIEDIKEYSSKTFHLLKISFTDPIKHLKKFRAKVQYTWPQCFNPHFDFLLIDPKNFAKTIERLCIYIHIDDEVITKDSVIFLHSIYMQTSEHINEGKFVYCENDKYFMREVTELSNEKMYYVKIKNNN